MVKSRGVPAQLFDLQGQGSCRMGHPVSRGRDLLRERLYVQTMKRELLKLCSRVFVLFNRAFGT